MHRRHFIKNTGLSLAGLLITDFALAGPKRNYVLQLPDTVEMLSGGQYISLESSDKLRWAYKDVIVNLKETDGTISAYVQSPEMTLQEIRLSWTYGFRNSLSVLGDHWERTYGDVSWQKIKPPAIPLPSS